MRFPVRIRAVPVHNAHGSIIGALETFEDDASAPARDRHEDSLKLPGFVDEVTGVASHAMMQSHLRETLGTFDEVQVPFSMLYFRLEGLQRFRANFGRGSGGVAVGSGGTHARRSYFGRPISWAAGAKINFS